MVYVMPIGGQGVLKCAGQQSMNSGVANTIMF